MGYEDIYVLRTRQLPLRQIDASRIHILTQIDEVKQIPFEMGIICTPTSMHAEQALFCLDQGMHVLVEKPLSHKTELLASIAEASKRSGTLLQVAYMMRFHPHLQKMHEAITNGSLGALLYIDTYWGSYLPDWHPWEDHTSGYAARKDLGGGAALTLSHDLDVANWLSNAPVAHFTKQYQYPKHLNIIAEGIADFQIRYVNNVIAHVHMNYIDRKPRRTYRCIFEQGSMEMDFFAKTLTTVRASGSETHTLSDFDRNELFIAELRHFISRINSGSDHQAYCFDQVLTSATIIEMCLS
jgi:predicted dehydrogenase